MELIRYLHLNPVEEGFKIRCSQRNQAIKSDQRFGFSNRISSQLNFVAVVRQIRVCGIALLLRDITGGSPDWAAYAE